MLEAVAGAITDAYPEARLSAESISNSRVYRIHIDLFSGRGGRARTLLYAFPDQEGGRTLAVVESKIEVGVNCEDEERI